MTGHSATPITRRHAIGAGFGTVVALMTATPLAAARPVRAAGTGGGLELTTLWSRGENGWVDFRVHAVDVTSAGTVLAFSEARVATSADDGPKDLVLRRSTDGGRTWGPTAFIEDHHGGAWANPTPVVDLRTGRITVFYALNAAGLSSRVFQRASIDDGVSWGDPIEVTDLFVGNEHGWTFHLPGPGRGIQLAGGRLLVEVWHRRSIDVPAAGRDYSVSVVYSDDGGRTWAWGGIVPDPAGLGLDEARIAQLATGEVIVNARLAGGVSNTSRAVARSRDGGLTFTDAVVETNIAPHAGIAAGLAARVDRNGVERVVYTSPVKGTGRDTLYARLSHDGAESWSWGRVIDNARAGYSDVVWLDDGTPLVLYSRLGGSGVETLDVVAARFDLAWLTQDRDGVERGPIGFLHTYQVEGLRAKSTVPRAPMALDPAAEGSAVTQVPAGAPGDAHAVTIVPAVSRPHHLRCRFRAPDGTSGGADVAVVVDGRPRGGVVAASGADPFLDVDLGIVPVRAGRPIRVEFVAAGPGPDGDSHAFQIDEISLVPRADA
ncbi:exo-alpha-sialidase [Jiangella sp. DSM 45060]|uniref:sialidase family protein n=1 Tax=Jiangella sp. DSM 45060 TaxID=1798224 RepID=UPI00087B76DE|nr:sialidase family protein [Jiangella sp. DSM 45060]SDT47491.1 BNR repeat-like domain-containing protein [Jiangella sp. DSM 45060]